MASTLKYWAWPAVMLSGMGLVASLVVHVGTLLGRSNLFGDKVFALHFGTFVVWIPAVFAVHRLTKDFQRRDDWRAALRGCPRWMKNVTIGFFVYALVNFAIFLFLTANKDTRTAELRAFSGNWMFFYAAAIAVLYSAMHPGVLEQSGRCLGGHRVPPLATYCEQCGAPVVRSV